MSDEKVHITVKGLKPHQIMTLYAHIDMSRKCIYESFAQYISSADGTIDLNRDFSVCGSYTGKEPMGLLWSMKPYAVKKRDTVRFLKSDVTSPLEYKLSLFDGNISNLNDLRKRYKDNTASSTTAFNRHFMALGVKRYEIRENGLVATLFVPAGEGPFPGLINMFGGYPGVLEFKSALHASHGFASLALAYVGDKHLPQSLSQDLNLEYFEKAVQFMKNHDVVNGGNGIGLVGICKGAQLCTAMAAFLKDIKCVVSINGMAVSGPGGIVYRDLHLPSTKIYLENLDPTKDNSLVDFCVLPLPGGSKYLPGFFPFHKKRDISYMFIFGEDDLTSPSAFAADETERYLKEENHPDYTILRYKKAGHLLEPPHAPFCKKYFQPGKGFNVYLNCGGEMFEHCKAQEDCWHKQLNFLKEKLMTNINSKL
ncbi:unnamed protein product [Clavelina lepadiformis]|uniref:Uncharacterized protein n=1 Tax=Clavelina lepadiformis TaxID=159417 RepID=A0ABP0FSV7_CLALP